MKHGLWLRKWNSKQQSPKWHQPQSLPKRMVQQNPSCTKLIIIQCPRCSSVSPHSTGPHCICTLLQVISIGLPMLYSQQNSIILHNNATAYLTAGITLEVCLTQISLYTQNCKNSIKSTKNKDCSSLQDKPLEFFYSVKCRMEECEHNPHNCTVTINSDQTYTTISKGPQ